MDTGQDQAYKDTANSENRVVSSQDKIVSLERFVADHEVQIEKLEERVGMLIQLTAQMDVFLREMLKAGHFEDTVNKIQGKPPAIIMGAK